MKITIGYREYKTKKEAEEYYRSLINRVGVCNDMLLVDKDAHFDFMELIKRHPDGDKKIHNTINFKIQRDYFNQTAYRLVLIRSNGEEDVISWKCCVTGNSSTPHADLMKAMRYAISDQIIRFRNHVTSWCCEECNIETMDPHIDHVIHFQQLVYDFHLITQHRKPTQFDKTQLFSRVFRKEDEAYEIEWKRYHQDKAVLRLLCKSCNLKRENWNGS